MRSRFVASMLMVLVLVCGCSLFSVRTPDVTKLTPDVSLVEGASSPWPCIEPQAMTPFPWGWVWGILTVGALATVGAVLKAPTLVDEVITITVGAVAVVVSIELVKEVWQAKWAIGFTALLVAVLLGAWKLGRKWFLKK